MARRNLLDNAPYADFLGKLPARPLADRASSETGGFAGQGHDVADLLGGDPSRVARARRIRQAVGNALVLETDRVEAEPTLAPEPHGIDIYTHLARNVGIVVSLGSGQDNACPYGELLGSRMASGQGFQGVPFGGSQRDRWWLGAAHSNASPRRRSMSRLHHAVGPLYHRNIRAQRY